MTSLFRDYLLVRAKNFQGCEDISAQGLNRLRKESGSGFKSGTSGAISIIYGPTKIVP
jgi:hypothetical protein